MEVNYQNLMEDIQGKWACVHTMDQITEEQFSYDFTLLISNNIISRNGGAEQYWPSICNFELVGSIKDGYFYREDGCFMQIKSVSHEQLVIELSHKTEEGALKTFIFHFEKELE